MQIGDVTGGNEMEIEWSQVLEGKQADGTYIVSEIGQILVSEVEFDMAQKLGGNPRIELVDRTAGSSYIPQYVVSRFIPRSDDAQRIAARDSKRLLALRQIYEATDGSINNYIYWSSITTQNGWSKEESDSVLFFLKDRGLIELRSSGPTILLTRMGLDEIENAIRNPRNRTHFFTASAVQFIMNNNNVNVSGGTVGAIQTGSNAQANVQQNIGVGGQELLQLFTQMRQEIQQLPDAQRIDALDYLEDLESEATSSEPKQSRLKSSGKALWELASGVLSGVSIAYFNHQLGVGS